MCPSGATPLGTHIQVVADKLGDGTEDRPNKITVISDGVSNNGIDPVKAARNLIKKYPNLQVDIIDVEGTPSLRQVADITGGKYFRTDNPDALLESLQSSIGLCEPPPPSTPPTDKRGCGSTGSW
jgi:Mg-chelatase subunit ChlD